MYIDNCMAVRDEFCHMIQRIKHFDGFFFSEGAVFPEVGTQLEIGLHSPLYILTSGVPAMIPLSKLTNHLKHLDLR